MKYKQTKINIAAIALIIIGIVIVIILIKNFHGAKKVGNKVEPDKKVQATINIGNEMEGTIKIGKDDIDINYHGLGDEPTIIFECGLACKYTDWASVQPEISKMARTFSYNRIELDRTSIDQVHELHALLGKTQVKGPYIIVAHSIGGFNARLFAGTYPGEVEGIVFVDSSHENQYEDNRLTTPGTTDKILLTDASQVKEIRKKDALRNIPIIVLTADHSGEKDWTPRVNAAWTEFQNDIASLSNNSKHIIVKNSGHHIQDDQPQVVIDAIKEIIKEVNKK